MFENPFVDIVFPEHGYMGFVGDLLGLEPEIEGPLEGREFPVNFGVADPFGLAVSNKALDTVCNHLSDRGFPEEPEEGEGKTNAPGKVPGAFVSSAG